MRFLRRTKIGTLATIVLFFPVFLLLTFLNWDTEAALTSGTSVHGHSGITTGGSTLTGTVLNNPTFNRPSIVNAASLDVDDNNDDYIARITGNSGSATFAFVNPSNLTNALRITDTTSTSYFFIMRGSAAKNTLTLDTTDAGDNGNLVICAGGACGNDRGAEVSLYGNEHAAQGDLSLTSGDLAGARVAIGSGQSNLLVERNAAVTLSAYTGDIALGATNGNVTVNTRFSSSRACAAGYTRVTPNYCQFSTQLVYTGFVRDTCTAIAQPTNALALDISTNMAVVASGSPVAASRDIVLTSYSDTLCASARRGVTIIQQQRLADANGTIHQATHGLQSVASVGGNFYFAFVDDTGNSNTASYAITGYYD